MHKMGGVVSRFAIAVAAAVGLPMLYVASFGPAYWLASRNLLPCKKSLAVFYEPLNTVASKSPGALRSWATLCASRASNQFWAECQNVWFDAGIDVPFQSGSFDQ
jgi:hypothetical protein